MTRWSSTWLVLSTLLALLWTGTARAQERCPATKSGALTAQSPTQLGRLQNGQASACGAAKAVPNVLQPTQSFAYQSFAFRNRSRDPQCVTVSVTATAGTVQSATYVTAYEPNNPELNYLGDGGGNANNGTITYGVTVPALAEFVVVVSANNQNAAATFDVNVTGCGAVVVTRVDPNAGSTVGGTNVTIKGSGFLANPGVTIGGAAATNVVYVDEATITATTPAGTEGAADVVVTNTDATSSTLPGGYLYVSPAATTITLASSKNPAVFGEAVTFTAKLSSGAGTPAGTVSFFDGATKLADAAIAAGTATLATSTLAVGAHPITVQYAGDATFAAATSPVVTQTVAKAPTRTSLVSSKNPSSLGDTVVFTATVAPVAPGAGAPTGNVELTDGGVSIGAAALDGTGKATFTVQNLTKGNHQLIATYVGSDSHATSASSNLVQSVGLVGTFINLVSSKNPSKLGETVTFTATVSGTPGGTIPTGSVTFKDGTAFNLGVAALKDGVAKVETKTLTEGTHAIKAIYNADDAFATSTSPILSQVVVFETGASSSGGSSSGSASSSGGSSSSGDVDAGTTPTEAFGSAEGGGCDCRASGSSSSGLSALGLGLAALAIASRRRGRR